MTTVPLRGFVTQSIVISDLQLRMFEAADCFDFDQNISANGQKRSGQIKGDQ